MDARFYTGIVSIFSPYFTDSSRLINIARFVLNASAFIFTVDPLTLPIFGQLPHHIRTSLDFQFEWAQKRRAADQLNNIIHIIERYRRQPSGSSFPDIPIAVMITKADLFKYTFTQSDRAIFMKNPLYGAGINLRDVALVDQEIRTLLRTYAQTDLLASTGRFEHVSFFATSATGEPPDENGHFHQVKPIRCLDPMLWILYQLGILKART